MKFPYIKFPPFIPTLKWINRPIIPIILIGPVGSWEGHGLIDSGADRCLFNADIARQIGLDLSKSSTEEFTGIEGGRIKVKIDKVKLRVNGIEEAVELNAGFVDSKGGGEKGYVIIKP